MAERKVTIPIETVAKGNGAKKATKDLQGLEAVQKRLMVAGKKLETLQTRHDRVVQRYGTGSQQAAKSQRNLGLATLEASRAFEDMQYGVRGALNNIPGLITMLGGGAGLAGVISVAAVGLTIAAKNFDLFGEEGKKAAEKGKLSLDKFNSALDENSKKIEEKLEKQAEGWDKLTEAIDRNIESLEQRNDIEDEIDDARLANDIAKIEQAEANGQLTKSEAIAAKAGARQLAQDRKDARAETVDYERIKAASEKAEAAEVELEQLQQERERARERQQSAFMMPITGSVEDMQRRQSILGRRNKEVREIDSRFEEQRQERDRLQAELRAAQERKAANDFVRNIGRETTQIQTGTAFTTSRAQAQGVADKLLLDEFGDIDQIVKRNEDNRQTGLKNAARSGVAEARRAGIGGDLLANLERRAEAITRDGAQGPESDNLVGALSKILTILEQGGRADNSQALKDIMKRVQALERGRPKN